MATKLNQLLAVKKGAANEANATITTQYHLIQKGGAFGGQRRTYQPLNDEGTKLPGESQKVQVRVQDVVEQATKAWERLIDVTATIDATNCVAKANVIVDGQVLIADVPATTLLWLEKQLLDVVTLIRKLPVLDPAEEWSYSTTSLVWESVPVNTMRSEKVVEPVILYPHTDKHPAQVEKVTKDVPAGTWTTVKLSGALPAEKVKAWLDRATKLAEAVKVAREYANLTAAVDKSIGAALLDYVFVQ